MGSYAIRSIACCALAAALLGPTPTLAQDLRFDGSDAPARVVGRQRAALILESEGPPLAAPREFFYRPSPPFDVRARWVQVQDSTSGVVFSRGSGVRADGSGFTGDLYMRALVGIRAVEVRALVFNLWGDLVDHLSATVLVDRLPGETWEFHPGWSAEGSTQGHRTSIVWVNRVMFDDQSILEADVAAVARAYAFVTGEDFEGVTDGPYRRAIGQ